MKRIEIRHEHPCTVDRFWELYFDEDVQSRLHRDVLEFQARELVARDETEAEIRRTLRLVPKAPQNVPLALRKFMGDGIEYQEHGVFDRKNQVQRIRIVPNRLTDRISITGTIEVEPLGEGCRRVLVMEIDVGVPMVGGKIEARIGGDVTESYDKAAVFYNEELRR